MKKSGLILKKGTTKETLGCFKGIIKIGILGMFLLCAASVQEASAYTLSATVNNGMQGYLIQSPQLVNYPVGVTVTLYAGARQGHKFTGWTGDVPAGQETANPLILSMDTTKTLMATFGMAPSGMVEVWGYNDAGECTIPSPNSGFVAVAAGDHHYLALKSDSSIEAGGDTWIGQCTVPSPNIGFAAVSAGRYQSLGLKSDGSIVAWAYDGNTQYAVPSPNSGFVAIAAGGLHNIGLKSNGSVVAWGDNGSGQCTVPSPNNGFVAVAAGGNQSLGLKSDGSVVMWGDNGCGLPNPNSGFVAVSTRGYHCLGLKTDGSVAAWGLDSDGQSKAPSPNSGFVSVAAGEYHSVGLKSNGSIVTWGRNDEGLCTVPSPNSGFLDVAAGTTHTWALAFEGRLQVTLSPDAAVVAGAQWRLTNEAAGVWHNSGDTVKALVGSYTLTFKDVNDWVKPADQQLVLTTSETTRVTGNYLPARYTLSTECNNGSILVSPSGTSFPPGTTVTLTALPDPNYLFDCWTGDVPSGLERITPLVLTMDGNKAIWVDFVSSGTQPSAPVVTSFAINNGMELTANPTVTLPNVCAGARSATHSYMASESPDFAGAEWVPYARVPMFTLSTQTSGTKTIYFKVKKGTEVESAVTSDTIAFGSTGYRIATWGYDGMNSLCTVPAPNRQFVAISGGHNHSLGLKSNGSVVAWGSNYDDPMDVQNYSGQCDVPAPNIGFVAVSAGFYRHSLGLKSNGSIVAWGWNKDYTGQYAGQCDVPSPNSGFVAVSGGSFHSLGLKSDGSIVVWGKVWNGSAYISAASPTPNQDFVAIAAGAGHSLGLKSDGSIVVWGSNEKGQCDVPSPNQDFVAIAAGAEHSLGLKSDGSVVAWGYNYEGQCNVPQPNTGFMAIAAGFWHSLGLRADGTLVGWGSNGNQESTIPVLNSGFLSISAGESRSLVLEIEGGVGDLQVKMAPFEAQGKGAQWRLTSEPVGVWHNSGETVKGRGLVTLTFKDISGWQKPPDQRIDLTGGGTTMASGTYTRLSWNLSTTSSNGSILVSPSGTRFPQGTQVTLTAQPNAGYCFDRWTDDVPTELKRTNPVTITMDSDRVIGVDFLAGAQPPAAAVLAFSINNGAAVTANPTVTLPNISVETTGSLVTHYMASESSDFTSATWRPYASIPMFTLSSGSGIKTVYFKVKGLLNEESAVMSDTIRLGGTGYPIVTWGDVSVGGGNQDYGQKNVPLPNSSFIACLGGYYHSLGLKSNGSIVGWGNCGSIPEPNNDFIALGTALGLKSDGSIVGWGSNDFGQRTIPFPNTNFVALAEGGYHSLGLKSDGTIVAWGFNYYGQCTVPEPNKDFVAIAAGEYHSLGLKSDGTVVAWGDGRSGVCTVPSPNKGFVAIFATGNSHSMGLKADGSIVVWGPNFCGECNVPEPNKDFVGIAAGINYCLGLKSDGTVVAWGLNTYGQHNISLPNTRFAAIAAGAMHSLALAYEIGTLTVTLGTPEAVAAGAQWRLADEAPGVWHNSGEVITPQVGVHTVTFKNVYGWVRPVDQQVEITTGGNVEVTGTYNRTLWTLSTVAENGSILVAPAGNSFPNGTTVTLTAQPDAFCWFDGWTGDVPAGMERTNPLILTMDGNKTITAEFVQDTTPPTAEIVPEKTFTSATEAAFQVTFSEKVLGFEENPFLTVDLTEGMTYTTVTVQRETDTQYRVLISGLTGDGQITLTINPASCHDITGNSNSLIGPSAPVVFDTTAPPRAEAPTADGPVSLVPQVSFAWSEVNEPKPGSGISGYQCQIGTASGFNDLFDGEVTSGTEKMLTCPLGQTVYCRVRAFDRAGNVGEWSESSTGVFVDTPPTAPVLAVSPVEPQTLDTVVPVAQASDPDGDTIAGYRYEWLLNDQVLCTSATLSPYLTIKNQQWTLRAWAQDVYGAWSDPGTTTFTIVNSPPTQPLVQVVPQPTRPDQDLIVDVLVYSTDPDGDAIKYDFKWYKSVDRGKTWIHKVELDGSPQVSQNFINKGELWDVFYTPYEVGSTQSVLQELPEAYTAASRPAGFAVAQAATRSEVKAMTAWDRSYVGENAPPEFQFDAIQTQWTTEGLQLSVNWTAVDGDGEEMQVDLSWTDLEYSGLVAVGSDLRGTQGNCSALVHPTPGKPFYLHAAVSDTKEAVTQVITRQINLSGLQVTNLPASEVEEETAVLNGALSSGTSLEAEVQVYWGRADGGQEPLAWEHVETLGTRNEGAFSVQITGLLPGTRYVYRGAAKNAFGEVWADDAQYFDTSLSTCTLQVEAVNGTVEISPLQPFYLKGTTVTLTPTPATGYHFTGWSGSITSMDNPLVVTMDSTKTLTANFELAGVPAPANVTAAGNTYRVLVSWDAVTSATGYGVERSGAGTTDTMPLSWTVGAVTEFADDTAVPGVTYSYTVTAVNAQGSSDPSMPATATVTAEVFAAANYKVTAKGYTLVRDEANNLTFTLTGEKAGMIKIAALKKLPANTADNAARGIYYLKNQGQVPTLAINGDVKTLSFDVPVYSLEAAGRVKSVSAKSVTFLSAHEFGSISISATKPSEQGFYARTFIETASASSVPMAIKVTGAVVEEVGSTTGAVQPVNRLDVASKVFKDATGANRMSLGAVGSLPRVVAEVTGTPAPQSEATPSLIQGSTLKSITVSGGPIVAEELVGLIDKVTVSGGNIRCGLIQSGKDLTLVQATARNVNGLLVGGAIGTAGQATSMVVKAQLQFSNHKLAIAKVYGQTGVSGYFYAGYADSFQQGGIGILQTKTGVVEGAAFLNSALVSKMKVLPKTPTQPILINPELP